MALAPRVRTNFVKGQLIASITSGSTTLTRGTHLSNADCDALPIVDSAKGEVAVLVFDPDALVGTPEIAYITNHAAAGNVTISRAQEGTTAAGWGANTRVVHGPTPKDFQMPVWCTARDGSAVLDGVNTFSWCTLSGSTYTMTADFFGDDLTINNGITLTPAGFRINCRGRYTNSGTVQANGASATSGSGATGTSTLNALPPGRSGGGGGTSTAGANGGAGGNSTVALAGGGGNGGSGSLSAGGTGGASGGLTDAARHKDVFRFFPSCVTGWAIEVNNTNVASINAFQIGGGGGGAGGGGDGTNVGGGGGAGADSIIIVAREFINVGTISANGGNGFSPTLGNTGGGGGGGGGVIILVYAWKGAAGTVTVTGGTKGTKHGTGSDGVNGSDGTIIEVALAA